VEHQARLDDAARHGDVSAFFQSQAFSDDELTAGLEDGDVVVDTRLRDALRTLRDDNGEFRLPRGASELRFDVPDVRDAASYAAEVAVLADVDAIHRAERRVQALERRLERIR
jgi:hypothetical protein